MQLVERHIIINNSEIKDICFKSARLYNFCNYYMRQSFFGQVERFKEYEISKLLAEHDQEDYRRLPAQTSQQVIKLLFKNWKSFYKSIKDFKKNPSKYTGCPRPPKYRDKKGYSIAIFTKQQVKIKDGFIHFPKTTNLNPLRTKVKTLDQVRIVPQANCFVIEVVYKKQITHEEVKKENFLSLDLGLDNLATSINNVGDNPFIINGKVLKSVNQMYNKTKSEFQSYVGIGTSNRMKKITRYRNNFIEDKMHKISRFIIDYCIKHKIGTIVIGKNEDWKRDINIGRRNNQNFTCIPHTNLIQKIKYKAELSGIEVIETEESYTSKIDHFALEPMSHQENYLGTRKHRGLFRSSINKTINADVNGAIGIARKVFGDSCISGIINSGLAFNPIRLNIV